MNRKMRYLYATLVLLLFTACSIKDDMISSADNDQIIHVGGVNADDLLSTAATTRGIADDDKLSWLKDGLMQGMNILYFKNDTEQHAVLKLETDGSFSLKTKEGQHCTWLGNGDHVFEGVYAPSELKQKKQTQTYGDLVHYTAIPPSQKIAATIGSITIPLKHRLARVQAYVLIDNSMKTKLKGYDAANHNGENTMLRFCNVKTLDYVNEAGNPVWKTERKAIPNYLGELGSIVEDNIVAWESFRTYKEKSTGKLYFPTDGEWKVAHQAYETEGKGESSGYICTDYGKVPSYDIIVRPTYTVPTTGTNVMYDEADQTVSETNQIDFELMLDNDLEYEKHFTFDLNANDETVVFLRVSPERIDYNSAGSRLWKETSYGDSYYGVNNQNGNSLSLAGNSWQRAFTNDTISLGVTDGHYYDADSENDSAQYVSSERWIDLLSKATQGGVHHGQYFILHNDITIDVTKFPEGFVFTGHLDALDHTITLIGVTESRNWLFGDMAEGWDAEVLNAKIVDGVLFNPNVEIKGHVNNCWNDGVRIKDVTPTIPEYK